MKRNLLRWVSFIKKQTTKLFKNKKSFNLDHVGKSRKLMLAVVMPVIVIGQIGVVPATAASATPIVTSMPMKLEDNILAERIGKVQITVGESVADKQAREAQEAAARAQTVARQVITRSASPARSYDASVEAKHQLAQSVAAKYGIDWKLLVAVWQVESGKSMGVTRRSSAGAQGPMQFMPGTWRAYGVDGDGDGAKDVSNVYDALNGGARYLAANGADRGDTDNALLHYNHSWSYVNKVKSVMNSI